MIFSIKFCLNKADFPLMILTVKQAVGDFKCFYIFNVTIVLNC